MFIKSPLQLRHKLRRFFYNKYATIITSSIDNIDTDVVRTPALGSGVDGAGVGPGGGTVVGCCVGS